MRPLLGIALKVASTVTFVIMNVLVQTLAVRLPVGEMAFARSFFGLAPVLVMAAFQGKFVEAFRAHSYSGHAVRAILGGMGMMFGFTALTLLPLTDAMAIAYLVPLLSVTLGALVLREQVRAFRWVAVVLGFVGVLIILLDYVPTGGPARAGTERSLLGVGVAIVAAAFSALATVQIRRLHRTESVYSIIIYFALFGSLVALTTAPFGWLVPSPREALLLVGLGLVGGTGQVFMTLGLRHTDVSILAPFDYLSLIWATLFSYLAFAILPSATMVIGALVVVMAGLLVFCGERRIGPRSAAQPE